MSEPLILVPLNGSKQALAALPVAKVLGELERAAVQILHVGEHELPREELRSRFGRDAPVLDDFTIDVRVGTPAVEILQAAGEIKPRVIVMCKHSGAERGKMLGRTAMKVLHDALCPVVLVPPERGAKDHEIAGRRSGQDQVGTEAQRRRFRTWRLAARLRTACQPVACSKPARIPRFQSEERRIISSYRTQRFD